MCKEATSTDISSITFSQALADGLTHCDWLGGPTICPSLRDRALASHSASQAMVEGLMTRGISGPLFGGYSASDDLQRYLANRLHQAMDATGSPEYELTWKRWAMLSGPPICALRALERPTSGSAFIGWPTPNAHERRCLHKPGSHLTVIKLLHGLAPNGKGRVGEPKPDGICRTVGVVANPEHYRWLMGYPSGWTYYGVTATPLSRNSPPSSSSPASKR